MTPWFPAREQFTPLDGERWQKYIDWPGLAQLAELISLDSTRCPPVLDEMVDEYWQHIVNEDHMLDYFLDLDFLKERSAGIERLNLLCVVRNPSEHLEESPWMVSTSWVTTWSKR